MTYNSKLTARNKEVLRKDRKPSPGPGVVWRASLLLMSCNILLSTFMCYLSSTILRICQTHAFFSKYVTYRIVKSYFFRICQCTYWLVFLFRIFFFLYLEHLSFFFLRMRDTISAKINLLNFKQLQLIVDRLLAIAGLILTFAGC